MQRLTDYPAVPLKQEQSDSKGSIVLTYTLIAGRYSGEELPPYDSYGVEIRLSCGERLEDSTVVEDITCDRSEAENLIDRLRRHTVTPVTVRDVIEDYLGACSIWKCVGRQAGMGRHRGALKRSRWFSTRCPYCGCEESRVLDSRPTEGERIRRRRECVRCLKRFTTYEMIESLPLIVVKKDKSRQAFDRNKLLRGLLRACEKRPVPLEVLERAVDEIEASLQNSLDREVTSQRIGELAMDKLKEIDEVAYVRFASVYRQFRDINTFMDELTKLLHDNGVGRGRPDNG